jgi:hypothetical protein
MKCKNCNQQLQESDQFCNMCGAKVIEHRLTLKHLAKESGAIFFNIDTNKPIKTFLDLFRKPENVINGFIQGVRKKYINAFGYFTIALTFSGLFAFIHRKWYPTLFESMVEGLYDTQIQTDFFMSFMGSFYEYQSLILLAMVPLLAFMSKLVFLKNKRYNYTEHLVINTYAYSHITILTNILYISTIWNETLFTYLSMFSLPLQMLYYFYCLKKLYSISIGKMLLKTLLFIVILGAVYFVLIILAGIYMVFFTDFLEVIKAEMKAEKAVSYIASSVINWTS